jgi:toxin FitB
MIVLDTDVLSGLVRPRFNPEVTDWLDKQPRESIWTTAVNIFESRSGINLLPVGRRRQDLNKALDEVLDRLGDHVLPFDRAAAETSARIIEARIPKGRNVGSRDTQIAGIVMSRNAVLATRNTKDFSDLEIALVNPWQA